MQISKRVCSCGWLFVASAALVLVPMALAERSGVATRPATLLSDKDDSDVVIKADELPQAIRDFIAKDIPGATIAEARKDFGTNKEKTGDHFTYEVDVKSGKKEFEYRFAPDGKLLKKRENAGDDADDKK